METSKSSSELESKRPDEESKGRKSGPSKGSGEGSTTSNESGATGGEQVPALPLDGIFEILKNERRRMTLEYLEEHETPVSLSDLAEHVAARENGITVRELTSTQRKRAYVGLYQCHLPKMDEMGAIDFNRPRGLISEGPHVERLRPYLEEQDPGHEWWKYYLGSASLYAAAFLGAVLVAGGSSTAATVVGGLAVLSFAVLATYHYVAETGADEARWLSGVPGSNRLPTDELRRRLPGDEDGSAGE